MKHVCVGDITYTNKKSFDTEKKALDFIKTLGNRWISTRKATYPDCEFWIITFRTEEPIISLNDISSFKQEFDGWSHEYSSVAITNTTLEEVVKVAKEYAQREAFCTFENCFYNGCEENGIVTFDAYRELPHNIAAFFSINLPNSVVYADIGWDYQDIYIQKNGKDYHEFAARWDDEEPEGYKEDGFDEEEDDELNPEDETDLYYDCFVTLTDNETGYEFHTGGGMCSENEFKMFRSLIQQHPQIQAKTL